MCDTERWRMAVPGFRQLGQDSLFTLDKPHACSKRATCVCLGMQIIPVCHLLCTSIYPPQPKHVAMKRRMFIYARIVVGWVLAGCGPIIEYSAQNSQLFYILYIYYLYTLLWCVWHSQPRIGVYIIENASLRVVRLPSRVFVNTLLYIPPLRGYNYY